jgi:5'-nucleotidase
MQINPATTQQTQNQNKIHTSILYINDLHAQITRMPEIKSEADSFEANHKDRSDVDSFVLAGGDSFISNNQGKNHLASSFLNLSKVEYSAMGNHEVDSIDTFNSNLPKTDTKFVVSNMKKTGATPFDDDMNDKRMVSSTIVEKNGHKYGLIGATPFKLSKAKNMKNANLSVGEYEKTKEDVQKEVKNLQDQGIDKIIMLSHIGYANDRKLAKEVSGIDVIVGGHSHDLVKDTKAGKNVLKSPDGNPVVIVQAGQNGEYIGQLDVTFDDKGKVIEATNDVKSTKESPKNLVVQFFRDRFLGKPKPLGTITEFEPIKGNPKTTENPYADFFADAMKSELGADIALINSANIRGSLQKGPLNTLDMENLVPFDNKLVKAEVSEKQLITALQEGANSVNDKMLKPGILQVSGLKYSIDEQGKIQEVQIQGKDGNFTALNVKNPSDDKKFTAVYDDFMTYSSEYPTLNNCKVIEKYPFDKTKLVSGYVEKIDKNNIKIKADGRITNKAPIIDLTD